MPYILDPNNKGSNQKKSNHKSVNYDYDYPEGMNLKPGSDLHEFILNEVKNRASDSYLHMSKYHSRWRETDRVLKSYIDVSNKEKDDDESGPTPRIVMPISYSIKETLLTYMNASFMQEPIFSYEGQGPEDVLGAELLTQIVSQQARRNKAGLAIHTMCNDGFKYGFGAVVPRWITEKRKTIGTRKTSLFSSIAEKFLNTGTEIFEDEVVYEGNEVYNIDPYRILPDTTVPIEDVKNAEYIGWIERTTYSSLLTTEKDDPEFIFNCRYLKHTSGTSSIDHMSGREGNKNKEKLRSSNPVDVIWMYIDLIPSDWENMGSSDYPETWLFGIAGDDIVIAAHQSDYIHNSKPVAITSPGFDGYSLVSASKLDIISDMQKLMDFLYSSHIHNIKKSLNDMFIADPGSVNMFDLKNPKPGKIIRLRRAQWGKGIESVLKQLDVKDVTTQHVQDTSYLSDMMFQVSGSTDILQGKIQKRGSRVSATEAQNAHSGGLSRLEMIAKIISAQGVRPLAFMIASNTQQYMSQTAHVKAVGETKRRLMEDYGMSEDQMQQDRVSVDPSDIAVHYDINEHDGTIPGSENVQGWLEVFNMISSNEQLMQHYDYPRIFKHIARQLGAKNVDDFVKQQEPQAPAVQDEETIEREVDRGNLVEESEFEQSGQQGPTII